MRSMKRVPLAILFLIAAALLAGTPASAAPWVALTPTGVEPDVSGQAKLSVPEFIDPWYTATLTVTCNGLTPNAKYDTTFGTYQTTRRGTLKGHAEISWGAAAENPILIDVEVYNGAGELVLFGALLCYW